MEKKVQYKFVVDDSFKDIAKTRSVEFSPAVKHAYTYFEAPSVDDRSFVVLRIKKSEGAQKIDMKIRNNDTSEWQHFESDIGNSEQMQAILEHLNCKPIFTFNKERQTWESELVRFDLDTTKELGTFLEVKFDLENRAEAEEFLQSLGIDPSTQDKRSVIEIYLEKYGK